MSLPFARLAKPGDIPNAWPEPSPEAVSAYLKAKAKHLAKLYPCRIELPLGLPPHRERTYSQTKTAIRLRAWRAAGCPRMGHYGDPTSKDAKRMRKYRKKFQ